LGVIEDTEADLGKIEAFIFTMRNMALHIGGDQCKND
jgi:hypothetical protein